jgi:hypothetical protein
MGLDGRVYFARESLPADIESKRVKLNPTTGEYVFENPESASQFPSDFSVATKRRLGNVSAIAGLRGELQSILGSTDSLLYQRCLCSGTHRGDVIEYELLDQLEAEIARTLSTIGGQRRQLLRGFLRAMADLVRVGKRERNPIVFV